MEAQRKGGKAVPHRSRNVDCAQPTTRVGVRREASGMAGNQQSHLACQKLYGRRRQHSKVVNVCGRRSPATPAHREDDRVVSECP